MPQANHLHEVPETPAGHLAHHLEVNYGLQLDAARHKVLVAELALALGGAAERGYKFARRAPKAE